MSQHTVLRTSPGALWVVHLLLEDLVLNIAGGSGPPASTACPLWQIGCLPQFFKQQRDLGNQSPPPRHPEIG